MQEVMQETAVVEEMRAPDRESSSRKVKVAYTMSRFPKLTETFILYEILALEKMGLEVELFPLLRERQSVVHQEAEKMLTRAHFYPFYSLSILCAHLFYIWHKPATYFKVLFEVFKGTFGSLNFFVGALGIYPKSVKMAYDMEKLGVDHLHAHFCTHPAVAALIIKRLTGIPYSFTAHGSDLHVERRMLDKKIEQAAFCVSVSSFNKKVMLEECGEGVRDKIEVVHCGVAVDEFIPASGSSKNGPFEIICVASFEEVKGHQYLVEACQILNEKGVDFRCHLIGYGPLKKKVSEHIRQLGLQEKILVHKPMSRPEILERLASADVKILASVPTTRGKREGIPVVLMEAMACGLPVVSSQLSGIPELVEDGQTGILVAPRDVIGLANALLKLHQEPDVRQKMGKAGRTKVVAEFNLSKNAQRLSELFLEHLTESKK
ncbi:MAG: glycosyltransferase [bacterium]